MLFIISYLLISGCVHNTPPTIEGIEESYEVHGYETLRIRVKAKDAEGDPLTIVWTQTAGKPLWKKAPSGFDINLLIPADLGEDQVFEITATVSDGKEEVSFSTNITLPAYRAQVVEEMGEECSIQVNGSCDEDEMPNTDIVFEIPSIDRYGVFNSSEFDGFEIKMSSVMGAGLDVNRFLDIILDVAYTYEDVKDMFAFDEVSHVLYVKEDRMVEFINLLKRSDEDRHNSDIVLSISGYDSLGHDLSKEITFKYGYGEIKGTLVDKEGNPYPGLEGETVFIKAASRRSYMGTGGGKGGYGAIVSADSTFEMKNLPVGMYDILLETSDGKSVFAVPVNINLGSPSANVFLEVLDMSTPMALPEPLDNAAKNQVKKQPLPSSELKKSSSEILKKHDEYLDALSVNRLQNSNENGSGLELLGSVIVKGGAQGVLVSKLETFTIPKEVSKVKVIYTLTSAEINVAYRTRYGIRYRAHDRWQAKATFSNGYYM